MAAEYTGDVRVGGPADVRELDGVTITKLAVGPMDNNAYLITERSSGRALLVDAANEADRLRELVAGTELARIVTTHGHFDHWQALAELVAHTGAPAAAHPLDAPDLPVEVGEPLAHGDRVAVGDLALEVIHLRGHTPGSVALLLTADRPHLFTGDSLFPGGPGRTTNPADFTSLMDDLEREVFGRLPDETWVYPGHGRDTTLGAERPSLAEWRARGW